MGLVFPAVVLLGFGFLVWWTIIRKIRNSIRDMSYTKGEVHEQVRNAMNDPRFKNMSAEERASLTKMNKYLDGED